jgi:hypothetical protein
VFVACGPLCLGLPFAVHRSAPFLLDTLYHFKDRELLLLECLLPVLIYLTVIAGRIKWPLANLTFISANPRLSGRMRLRWKRSTQFNDIQNRFMYNCSSRVTFRLLTDCKRDTGYGCTGVCGICELRMPDAQR